MWVWLWGEVDGQPEAGTATNPATNPLYTAGELMQAINMIIGLGGQQVWVGGGLHR